MKYPKIYLVCDNCFAIKRWVHPFEWMDLLKKMGITCIEASTDNECDPFYTGYEGLLEWLEVVKKAQKETGSRVVNFCTSYSTYRTIGLLHEDKRLVKRIVDGWLKPIIKIAGLIDAGLGFYFHAFPEAVLQDPLRYNAGMTRLHAILAEIISFAGKNNNVLLSYEQMYSPQQTPWTIEGSVDYLRRVYQLSKTISYLLLDTGHQTGQAKFLRPGLPELRRLLEGKRQEMEPNGLWLGPASISGKIMNADVRNDAERTELLSEIQSEMDRFPYLFAEKKDCDLYSWLRRLGCYSRIIHIHQNDGTFSGHLPFTAETNKTGVVKPDKVLAALAESYEQQNDLSMPPKSDKIFLTFEMFAKASEQSGEILRWIKDSINCWREAVPEDGLSLDKLL